MGPKIGLKFTFWGVVFWTTFWTTFGQFWGLFWGPFWDQIGPRRGQDEPKRAIESFKDPKTCICKNLKKPSVFLGFWGPEASQKSLRKPKKAPKRHPRSSKASKKGIQKWTSKLSFFLPILEPFWGPFWGPNPLKKGSQNWTSFGTPRLRLSGVWELRFCELNRSGEIAIAIGIIFAKRKGGIGSIRGLFQGSLKGKFEVFWVLLRAFGALLERVLQ